MRNSFILVLITILTISACIRTQDNKKLKPIKVVYDIQSTQQTFGLTSLSQALQGSGYTTVMLDRKDATGEEEISINMLTSDELIQKEGFSLTHTNSGI